MEDLVRVLKIVEYIGPRKAVEALLDASLHGAKKVPGDVLIRVGVVGDYPELLGVLEDEPPKIDVDIN